jgi:hypothetical protein
MLQGKERHLSPSSVASPANCTRHVTTPAHLKTRTSRPYRIFQRHRMACRPPCSREWARLLAAGGELVFVRLLRLYPERPPSGSWSAARWSCSSPSRSPCSSAACTIYSWLRPRRIRSHGHPGGQQCAVHRGSPSSSGFRGSGGSMTVPPQMNRPAQPLPQAHGPRAPCFPWPRVGLPGVAIRTIAS